MLRTQSVLDYIQTQSVLDYIQLQLADPVNLELESKNGLCVIEQTLTVWLLSILPVMFGYMACNILLLPVMFY